MTTQSVTINSLLDMALEEQADTPKKRRRQRILKDRLENPRFRQRYTDNLIEQIPNDPRFAAACPALAVSTGVVGSEQFHADAPFMIDTGKIKELLDLFIEYAPKIAEILLTIFKMFAAVIIAVGAFAVASGASHAQAQDQCIGGVCLASQVETVCSQRIEIRNRRTPLRNIFQGGRQIAGGVLQAGAHVVRGQPVRAFLRARFGSRQCRR